MSNADFNCSSTVNTDEQQQADTSSTLLDAADNNSSNNTSLIGKVKLRVSGILPNTLSKWFSTSTHKSNEDTLESSGNNATMQSRRRQRSDLDQSDDEEGEDVQLERGRIVLQIDENTENNARNTQRYTNYMPSADINALGTTAVNPLVENNEMGPISTFRNIKKLNLNTREPPTKRSRVNEHLEETFMNPLEQRQPLLASTPAIENNNIILRNSKRTPLLLERAAPSRSKFLNLYAHEEERTPAYEFNASVDEPDRDINIAGALKRSSTRYESSSLTSGTTELGHNRSLPVISQRRTGLMDLKRQKLDSLEDAASRNYHFSSSLRNSAAVTGATVTTEVNDVEEDEQAELEADSLKSQTNKKYNGLTQYQNRRMHMFVTNGDNVNLETSGDDSGNERRSEFDDDNNDKLATQSTSSGGVLRNVSRTSSFGNSLNFYAHLEGRKSLFKNTAAATATTTSNEQLEKPSATNSALNNSTLSLTSLHRRRFNDSIYGSTSALSDSRLLNIHSPFYKGNTAYGGASSYSRYNFKGNNSMLSMRALPIQMRPTSSLSSMSSSTQANSHTGGQTLSSLGKDGSIEPVSNISNTAKRILDLINDFTTPLNEAKKMASNLNVSNQQTKLNVRRLTDNDVQLTRAMRLSHVQKPYMRAAVTLQPHKMNGNNAITTTTTTTTNNDNLPPIRGLQVPSMSQILKMKQMHNTTERSRQTITNNNKNDSNNISNNNNNNNEYNDFNINNDINKIVPTINESNRKEQEQTQKFSYLPHLEQQQQHCGGKIKNKVTASARVTRSKNTIDDHDDELPPLDLPNIAFPLMQNVPKFDMKFSKPIITNKPSSTLSSSLPTTTNEITFSATTTPITTARTTNFNYSGLKSIPTPLNKINNSNEIYKDIVFSSPQTLNCSNGILNVTPLTPINNNFTFSAPTLLSDLRRPQQKPLLPITATTTPQLRTGSCLDALKTPLFTTTTTAATVAPVTTTTTTAGTDIWAMAKKVTTDWECSECMLRNKSDVNKCVACETPRKCVTTTLPTLPIKKTFGDAFKHKSDTWESTVNSSENLNATNVATTSISTATTAVPFQFGFTNAPKTTIKTTTTTTAAAVNSGDALFKSIASAQAAKWECDTCMTRNEMSRNKCVSCEMSKPGAVTTVASNGAPKFAFGETAKNQFTFGFANTKTTSTVTAETSTAAAKATSGDFNFNASKDVADANLITQPAAVSEFKFGMPTTTTTAKTVATVSAVASSVGFTFGIKPKTTTTTTTTETTTTPSVKFNLPTTGSGGVTSSSDIKTATSDDTTSTNNTLLSGGFSFDNKSNVANITAGLAGGTTVSSTSGTFTFGTSITSPAATKPPTTTAAKTSLFNSATTTPITANATAPTTLTFGTTTPPAPTLLFGAFGANTSTATTTLSAPSFATTKTTTTVGATTISTIAPTVSSSGGFGSNLFNATSANIFGGFKNDDTKSTTTTAAATTTTTTTATVNNTQTTLFGNIKTATSTPFAFGGVTTSTSTSNNNNSNVTAVSSSTTTTSGTWQKNSFVFGNAQQQQTPSSSTVTTSSSEVANKPIFGGFGQSTIGNSNSSLFGTTAKDNTSAEVTRGTSGFGLNAASKSSFGNTNNNVFGNGNFNAAGSTAAAGTGASTFGASAFGNNVTPTFGNSGTNIAPTFGNSDSNVTKTATFSAFGGISSGNSTTNVIAEPKKTEPVFNFGGSGGPSNNVGSTATSQNNVFGSISGMGTSNAKPAFNFPPVNQPAFNFTRTTEQQTPSATPFHFGTVAPAAPIYNFSAGNAENTTAPSAPFQFNATGVSPSTNIFAPNPTAGVQSAAQQIRRKIRTPVRRLPPR